VGDVKSATETEIIAFCKAHVASYKAFKSVDFTASLPKNPQGKILKRKLMEKYRAGREQPK